MKYKHFFDKRSSLDIELPDIELDNYPGNWYSPQRMLHQAMSYKKLLDKQFKLAVELDDSEDNWMEGKQRSS